MNKKSTGLLLSILGVLSLVLITAGVTYAFFSYTKEGTTENTISTGTITFFYDELEEQAGNGIKITDALPMSDDDGKALTGSKNVFNFKVTSTIKGNADIAYYVTARKKTGSTLANDKVKLYLTSNETGGTTTGTNYTVGSDGKVETFAELSAPTTQQVALPKNVDERLIFEGIVPKGNNTNYSNDFALRMWVNGDSGLSTSTDYSPYEFVLKTVATPTETGTTSTTPLAADALITAGTLIRSTDYYALNDDVKANYERIAYVNMTDRTIYTVGQAKKEGFVAPTTDSNWKASEQFYQINGQTFTVTVNVYSNATVVPAGN